MPRIITLQGVKAIDETIKRTILEVLDRHRITAPMLLLFSPPLASERQHRRCPLGAC